MEYKTVYVTNPQNPGPLQAELQLNGGEGWELQSTEMLISRNKRFGKLGTPKQTMVLIFKRPRK